MSPASKEKVLKAKGHYPVLALRDVVVFPHMVVPLFVGREKSVKALDLATKKGSSVFLLTQIDSSVDDPAFSELHDIGSIARILQVLRLPDGTVKVLVEGVSRGVVVKSIETDELLEADVKTLSDLHEDDEEEQALVRTVLSQFDQYIKLNRKFPADLLATINQISEPGKLSDVVVSHMDLKLDEKQKLLAEVSVVERLEKIVAHMEGEIGVMVAEKKIRTRVKSQMEKTQREYYLNEQLKAIQKELGDGEEGKDEITEIEDRIKAANLPKEALERARAEVRKLKQMSPMSAEATVVRNYLEWLLDVPWSKAETALNEAVSSKKTKASKKTLEAEALQKAEEILNADHYGLEKVKERILEYLAVQNRVGKVKGPILCLVGPPGVGKTSLGASIAKATGREFVRMSLGGVRDEAEIRGHRRTYIGSMPGKIIQGMKKAGVANPLFLLDEIDKLASDWRGDPTSALLEVLDPAQNSKFNDHYLELDYDLSNVMFVTTSNSLNMPQPLLDRMEIIRISGYTEDEKLQIAKRHLIPKLMTDHNLKPEELVIDDSAILGLIQTYTREAGVRSLERELANICRKAVRNLAKKGAKDIVLSSKNLNKYAGIPRFHFGEVEEADAVGMTTGLAWTEVGGELLLIEAVVMPGKGKSQITGKLGEVMQESVQAAISYVRSRATTYGIYPPLFEKRDIHVHVPEGATPKDGPSAGIAMCTSIVSALTGIPVRKDIAMTGEVTLRGKVLPIGGLKEKLLAAHRGGIKMVLIPKDNEKDLAEIPDNIKGGLKIIPVSNVDQVLEKALIKPLKAVIWDENLTFEGASKPIESDEIRPH